MGWLPIRLLAIPDIHYSVELRSIVAYVAHLRVQVFVTHSLHHDVWALGPLHYHRPEGVPTAVRLDRELLIGTINMIGCWPCLHRARNL